MKDDGHFNYDWPCFQKMRSLGAADRMSCPGLPYQHICANCSFCSNKELKNFLQNKNDQKDRDKSPNKPVWKGI